MKINLNHITSSIVSIEIYYKLHQKILSVSNIFMNKIRINKAYKYFQKYSKQ
jgi:hypothetical protein